MRKKKHSITASGNAVYRFLLCVGGIYYLTPVKVASFKGVYERLGSGDVRCHGDVVYIAQPQKIHFVRLMRLRSEGISEKEEQVYLIAGDTGAYLLIAAL